MSRSSPPGNGTGYRYFRQRTPALPLLNRMSARLQDFCAAAGAPNALAEEAVPKKKRRNLQAEQGHIRGNLDRVYHLKKSAYEDYRAGLLTQADYLRYKEDYDRREKALSGQMVRLEQERPESILERPWIASLLKHGKLSGLDRTTMAETVKEILVFKDGHIEITYLFCFRTNSVFYSHHS